MKFKVGDTITDQSLDLMRRFRVSAIGDGMYSLWSCYNCLTYISYITYIDSKFELYNPKPFEGSVEFTIE